MGWLDIGTAASLATTISVILLLYQIVLNGQRATSRFEDELVNEYRDVIDELPLEALLGEELSDDRYYENLHHFYRYIDLSNEQVFLRQENQIRKSTWENWRDGIKSNLSRPAFNRAWREIKSRSEHYSHKDFTELRDLEDDFDSDPYLWSDDRDNIDKQAKHNWRRFSSRFSNAVYTVIYILLMLFSIIVEWIRNKWFEHIS